MKLQMLMTMLSCDPVHVHFTMRYALNVSQFIMWSRERFCYGSVLVLFNICDDKHDDYRLPNYRWHKRNLIRYFRFERFTEKFASQLGLIKIKLLPLLKHVLRCLDLFLCTGDCNDTIRRPGKGFINLDERIWFRADSADAATSLANDGTSQL